MSDDLGEFVIPPNTPEQRQQARITICGHAPDVDEARLLLDMLGLLEDAQ
jgi:hypothetical protein